MTDEMIEAVARAIFDTAVGADKWDNRFYTEERRECAGSAKAAIKAFKEALAKAGLGIRPREPTPDQENAGRGSFDLTKSGRENCVLVWQAMWDAHPDKPNG